MKSIKQQFLATAIAIAVFLVALGFFTQLSIRRTMQHNLLSGQLKELAFLEVALSKTERDFLLFESVNPDFFQTRSSDYITTFDSLISVNELLLKEIQNNRIIIKTDQDQSINQIIDHYEELAKHFSSLSNALYEYGYENYGLSGKMRRAIHQVEQTLAEENHHELTSMMLMLRRHEKDFMIRKDVKYVESFDNTIEEFVEKLQNPGLNPELTQMVRTYQRGFHELAGKEIEMGTASNQGILHQINNTYAQISPLIMQVQKNVNQHTQKQTKIYTLVLIIAFVMISLGIILVYSAMSGRIVSQLLSLKDYITRLGMGQLPEIIAIKKQDEIGQMIHSVNILTDNLRNTRSFALEVGKGNFNTEINVFNNKGDLGESLIKMKNQLQEVARQQEKHRDEEKQRTWIAEGTALFSQILREKNNDIDEMSFAVIKNLVNYLEIIQGGLFTVVQENSVQQFLLSGCYAYDRKKFTEKKLEWGEGLIGACALEKEPIYLTDLPTDYINITSGLGHANPDSLLIVPLVHDERVFGVIELAALGPIPRYKQEFVYKIAQSIAAHISLINNNKQTQYLLHKSEEMAENLRQQEEELKQNMEEMMATQEEAEKEIQRLKREIAHKNKQMIEMQLRREEVSLVSDKRTN